MNRTMRVLTALVITTVFAGAAASLAVAHDNPNARVQLTWDAADSTDATLQSTAGPATLYLTVSGGLVSYKGADLDLTWTGAAGSTVCVTHAGTEYPQAPDCKFLNRGTPTATVLTDVPGHLHVSWTNSASTFGCPSGVVLTITLSAAACAAGSTTFQIQSLTLVDASGLTDPVLSGNLGRVATWSVLSGVCTTPPTGCVAWFPMDEGVATNAAQDIVWGHDASYFPYQALSHVTGKVANGLRFQNNNQYCQAADAAVLNFGTGDFSIDGWVKSPLGTAGALVCKWDPTSVRGYCVGFDLIVGNCSAYVPYLVLGQGSGAQYFYATGGICDANWHFICVTVKRGSPSAVIWTIDGYPSSPQTIPGAIGTTTNTQPLWLGRANVSPFPSGFWTGYADELELFNKVLAPTEVASIYNSGPNGKCKEECHVEWDIPFCPATLQTVNTTVQVCNFTNAPQTYTLSAVSLPAGSSGSGGGCSINGPTVFCFPVGNTCPATTSVTLSAGQCLPVTMRITRPSGMLTLYDTGCFEVQVVSSSGSVLHCRGSVEDRRDLCPMLIGPTGGDIDLALTVATPVNFTLMNPGTSPLFVRYLIETMPAHMDPANMGFAQLDNLPPGTAASGTVTVDAGASVTRQVTLTALDYQPFNTHDLVLSTDNDGDGVYEALASVGFRTSREMQTSVGEPSGGPGSGRHVLGLTASPNPTRGTVLLRLSMREAMVVEVQVEDIAGRVMQTLPADHFLAGTHYVVWNGKDSHGRRVPAGMYVLRAQGGSAVAAEKVFVVR